MLNDEIEWIQFRCKDRNKNVNILVNKNGTIINTTQLGLADDSNGYFHIKTIDSKGNLITSKSFDHNECILKLNTDGSLEKFDLKKDLIVNNDTVLNFAKLLEKKLI